MEGGREWTTVVKLRIGKNVCSGPFFFFNNLLYFVCMDVLPAYAPHMCLVPEEAKRDVRASGTRGIESCEPPCGSWESVLGPLEEQSMPLTT